MSQNAAVTALQGSLRWLNEPGAQALGISGAHRQERVLVVGLYKLLTLMACIAVYR